MIKNITNVCLVIFVTSVAMQGIYEIAKRYYYDYIEPRL